MLDPWELADAKKNLGIKTPDAAGEGGNDLAAHSEDFFKEKDNVCTFVAAQKIWHSMSFGFLAQNKDNADKQHANRWLNHCDQTDQSHSEVYQ